MNHIKIIFTVFIFTLSIIAQNCVFAEDEIQLDAFVDQSTATIGDKIRYTIVLDAETGVKFEFPQFGNNVGGFAVKDFEILKPKKSGINRVKHEQWYLLDTYTVGSYIIPSQEIIAEFPNGRVKTLTTPELFIEIKSVLGENAEQEGLRDIKDPVDLAYGIRPFILGLLAVLLLLAGIFLWRFYQTQPDKQISEPPLEVHEIALHELERIENMELIQKGDFKEYYYLVSDCLRHYLENRFSLRAPEQTTEEFLESISRSDVLEGRQINLLKDYLRHCDLVKYAKLKPDALQARELIDKTRTFIDETKRIEEISEVRSSEITR